MITYKRRIENMFVAHEIEVNSDSSCSLVSIGRRSYDPNPGSSFQLQKGLFIITEAIKKEDHKSHVFTPQKNLQTY